MRCLARNLKTITYQLYLGNQEEMDDNGNYTGNKPPVYSDPVSIRANVSASRGSADLDMFGVNIPYTNTVLVDDLNCPIDENSRIEIDGNPYAVLLVAKSLNHIAYAVRRLTAPQALNAYIPSH